MIQKLLQKAADEAPGTVEDMIGKLLQEASDEIKLDEGKQFQEAAERPP